MIIKRIDHPKTGTSVLPVAATNVKLKSMISLGQINHRKIFYTAINDQHEPLIDLPSDNWLAFIIGDEPESKGYSDIADLCLEKKVAYVCTVGQSSELIHDIFDELIVTNKISHNQRIETPADFEDAPMTTCHHNFDEGFWFALMAAYNDPMSIDTVVCIDSTENRVLKYLTQLIAKMQSGWVPSDDEENEPKYDN